MAVNSTPPTPAGLANAQIQRVLGLKAASECLGVVGDESLVEIGPLAANNFSFTFHIRARTRAGLRQVFVKIPKIDMRGRAPRILPISPEDRQMAIEEEASLRLLSRKWTGDDLDVRWANLCGTVPEFNALVTDRIMADDAFRVFRRWDLARRFGFRGAKRLQQTMARLGAALGRFHQTNARIGKFRLSESLPKYGFYCQELSVRCGNAWPERIQRKLESIRDSEFEGIEVPTLKGLDLRNMLIDRQDRLYLLDPGKMKLTCREADLARFIMTYRILFWGSSLLLFTGEADPRAEAAFLDAYYANSRPACPQLLNLFMLKEQLKHWHTALDSLQYRFWPPMIKRLAAGIYVNPFYTSQVARQLELIAG